MNDNNRELMLEEWKAGHSASMHFNDLLMRVRAFGLPAVATIIGGATAYTLTTETWRMKIWLIGTILIAVTIGLFIIVGFLIKRENFDAMSSEEEVKDVCLWQIEKGFWRSVPAVTALYTVVFWWFHLNNLSGWKHLSLGVFLIVFALMLLICIYALDRFYYYCLLIGAIHRKETLERQLGFALTKTITDVTPRHRSATVISTLYFLPGILGYIMLLTLIVFL